MPTIIGLYNNMFVVTNVLLRLVLSNNNIMVFSELK